MRFQSRAFREPPEINFIPLIDVLLVILIFLMVTTTYSRFAELQINLPTADTHAAQEQPSQIEVVVTMQGDVLVNKTPVGSRDVDAITAALQRAAGGGAKEPVVVINADAKATHQSVIDVMQAAQHAGLTHISFATQQKQ